MPGPAEKSDKSLMRSLGECVGHVLRGIRSQPDGPRRVVRHDVEEADQGNVILRRTTIEEIELKGQTEPDEHVAS